MVNSQLRLPPGIHLKMGSCDKNITDDEEQEEEVASAFDTTFWFERDLQMTLRSSIEQLEQGLATIDGDHEQTVTSGRIDIKARDKDGWTVVTELKAGVAEMSLGKSFRAWAT